MRLDIPLIQSHRKNDCAVASLKMVLNYFGELYSSKFISNLERQFETGLVWTAGIARAAAVLDFPVKFYTKMEDPHEDIEFYKNHAGSQEYKVLDEILVDLNQFKVDVINVDLSCHDLKKLITHNSVPIILLNWYTILGKDGFYGHLVPITGYDKNNFYINNPGTKNPKKDMSISKDLFMQSWNSKGTDNDLVVIYKKF